MAFLDFLALTGLERACSALLVTGRAALVE
jgi:hypothetical protein